MSVKTSAFKKKMVIPYSAARLEKTDLRTGADDAVRSFDRNFPEFHLPVSHVVLGVIQSQL